MRDNLYIFGGGREREDVQDDCYTRNNTRADEISDDLPYHLCCDRYNLKENKYYNSPKEEQNPGGEIIHANVVGKFQF